jgi:hypothetical protein
MQLTCTFVWGLLVLLAFIGWGRVAGLWIDRDTRLGSGLCAAWGVAIVLLLGGILNATRLCGYGTVIAIVLAGAIFFAADLRQHPPKILLRSVAGFAPLALVLGGVYLASIAFMPTASWNLYDDYVAYLIYPIKMLQTGAADDPFSLRRLSTLGGSAFLQALACFPMWPRSAFLVDMGLGNVICCLLIAGFLWRRKETALMASVPCFALLLLPIGRLNTMFIMLGIAGFLALFKTLLLAAESTDGRRHRLCAMAGAIATGLVTLRPNFIPAAGLTLVLWAMLRCIKRRHPLRAIAGDLLISLLTAAVCFLPWSIALYRSSASLLWPLMLGNEQRRFNISTANLPLWPLLGFVVFFFFTPLVGVMVSLGLLAMRNLRREAIALWLAAIIGSAMTVARFSLSDYPNLTRYSLPPLAAAAIAALLCTQLGAPQDWFRKAGRVVMALLFIGLLVTNVESPRLFLNAALSLQRGIWLNLPLVQPGLRGQYAAVQGDIPPGKTVLCAVDDPFLFNFRRNTIFSADLPGMASPGAALPYAQGPAALALYLKQEGVDYVLCANFDAEDPAAFYSRHYWNFRLTCPMDTDGRVAIDRVYAAAALDFMGDIDGIAQSDKNVLHKDGMRVIRLR